MNGSERADRGAAVGVVAVGGSRFLFEAEEGGAWLTVGGGASLATASGRRGGEQLKPWDEQPRDSHGPTLAPPPSCSRTSLADSRSSLTLFLFFQKNENFNKNDTRLVCSRSNLTGTPLLPNVPHRPFFVVFFQLVSLTLKAAAGVITPPPPSHSPHASHPADNYRPFH
jgi:hypothetical protein